MEHSFNVEIAKKNGVEEAIVLHNLYFWIAKNAANDKHLYDGCYWTYNSAEAFSKIFPYMSSSKIYRIMKCLEEKELVKIGNYNQSKYNHTKWYAFSEKGMSLMKECGYDVDVIHASQSDSNDFAKMENHDCENVKSQVYIDNRLINFSKETDNKQHIKELKESEDLFETCWKAYRRKGVKKPAKAQWQKLSDKEKELVLPHIKAYVATREVQYQKDFERYLRDRLFKEVVYSNNKIVYDPQKATSKEYMPSGHNVYYDELRGFYYYTGFYMRSNDIMDSYTDEKRPDGAKLCLNNARGVIQWNANNKEWRKIS